ncbi:MAG TPA: LysM peptidoglycan-binding domain-containing protein [Bacillota bacterium]|nr:LysM peptidoglycan-binding domain-containing protein [Bacillota bacterium]
MIYKIKPGETLEQIASKFGVTPRVLGAINPGLVPTEQLTGRIINIPEKPSFVFYRVKAGDSLWLIGKRFGVSEQVIAQANNLRSPYTIQVEQWLKVPLAPAAQTPFSPREDTFVYTVKSGDTLYKLAQEYNTTVETLVQLNNITDPDNLAIGQQLQIPVSGTTPEPTTTTPEPTTTTPEPTTTTPEPTTTTPEPTTTTPEPTTTTPEPTTTTPEPTTTTPLPTTLPPNTFVYIVQPGDTLYKLAQQFNTTVNVLVALNGITNPNVLSVGQPLLIPVPATTTTPEPTTTTPEPTTTTPEPTTTTPEPTTTTPMPTTTPEPTTTTPMPTTTLPPNTFVYIVRPGDTLYKIAKRFNTTVSTLVALNGITNPDVLSIGQPLIVPIPPTSTAMPTTSLPPNTFIYIVKPGDSLYKIAHEFGTTVDMLVMLNGISNPNVLAIGQMLLVPQVTGTTPGPTTTTPQPTTTTPGPTTTTPQPTTTFPPTIFPPSTMCPDLTIAFITYQVQPGDTLPMIAQAYNTSVEKIMQENNIVNGVIYPGQLLYFIAGNGGN